MTTSISVSEATKDRLQQFKESDVTWDQLLQDMANEYADGTGKLQDTRYTGEDDQAVLDVDAIAEQLDASQADIERVMNRLDDLENTIPRKTAEELQR